jgi:hypothetical protein
MNLEQLNLKDQTYQKLLQINNNSNYKFKFIDAIKNELEEFTVVNNKYIVNIICNMLSTNDISFDILDILINTLILNNKEGTNFCKKLIN